MKNGPIGWLAGLVPRAEGVDPERAKKLKELTKRLGVRIKDLGLLNQALMHRSYVYDADLERNASNERMEFLGDAVLGLVVNEYLYARFGERQEGRLTKIKSLVVSESVLSKRAEEIDLGEFILLSDNERDSGGATRSSIISDAFEAVICAIYLDSGLKAARRFIHEHLLRDIDELLEDDDFRNYKSLVQEHAQKKYGSRPRYRVVSVKGPEHARTFFVELKLKGRATGRGEGKSKKEAEQMAARNALKRLGLLAKNGRLIKRKPRSKRSGSRRSRRGRRRKKEKS
ncbi:MAG: ribonuclease III [Candidatus Eisenbacteria bacterium]|nr:ribonuclease III [Candidatus Eisenbacteria bacterium]